MSHVVEATHENGVLKLEQPLPFKDQEKVRVTVASLTTEGHSVMDIEPVSLGKVRRPLLVDDDRMIRTLGTRLLEHLGYQTLLAENGEAALELYRQRSSEISFVILDLAMPVMDGAECFQSLRKIDPEASVLICSGYFQDAKVDALIERGAIGFIQKPYTTQSLAVSIDTALSVTTAT